MTLSWLDSLAIVIISTVISWLFELNKAYFHKKGENLATQEDIGEITAIIEETREIYSQSLEELRAILSSQSQAQLFRYQKEYQLLFRLSKYVVRTRDSALQLRPCADVGLAEGETDQERRIKRVRLFQRDAKRLYYVMEPLQPFYPEEIYTACKELQDATLAELSRYSRASISRRKNELAYWEDSQNQAEKIEKLCNEALVKIRGRIETWKAIFPLPQTKTD